MTDLRLLAKRFAATARRNEDAVVLLAGIVALSAVAAGVCGLALWLLPGAPAWAVKLVILGGSLAVSCLALLWISAQGPKGGGVMGLLKLKRLRDPPPG